MPRSPRATMIPLSAAWMIASAFSAACGFSIFAISGMSAPRSASRALDRLAGPRARGRTRPRAGRSPARPRSRPSRGRARPPAGRPRSAPGRLRPWCEATGPPTSTAQRRPRRPSPGHAQPDPAVGEVDVVALGDRRRQARPTDTGRWSASRRSRSWSSGVSSEPCLEAPPRRPRPRRAGASAPAGRRAARPRGRSPPTPARIRSMFSACSSRVPCEKLSRKTSAPARISSASVSTERVAGPIVATIFVRPARRVDAAGLGSVASAGASGGAPVAAAPRASAPVARRLGRRLERAGCRAAATAALASTSPTATESMPGTTGRPRAARGRRTRAPGRPRGPARRGRRARRPSPACSSGS